MSLLISSNKIGTPSNASVFTNAANGGRKVPCFSAFSKGGSSTVITAGHIITYNTVEVDNFNGYNTTTFRYTIPVTGIWYIHYNLLLGTPSGDGATSVYRNGSIWLTQFGDSDRWIYSSWTQWTQGAAEMIGPLSAGDYIDVRQAGQAGQQYYSNDINNFCGYLIGAV